MTIDINDAGFETGNGNIERRPLEPRPEPPVEPPVEPCVGECGGGDEDEGGAGGEPLPPDEAGGTCGDGEASSRSLASASERYGNGCGPQGWKAKAVPDHYFGFDFSNACEDHDECYGRVWGGMRKDCEWPLDRAVERGIHTPDCFGAAQTYYQFVRWFGAGAFREAQLAKCPFSGPNRDARCRRAIERRNG